MAHFLTCYLSLATIALGSVPEPAEYILSYPTGDNYLNLTVHEHPEKNYIILIGDWGADRNNGPTQHTQIQEVVGKKLQSFVNKQKSNGYNLLFVATVGDNFYHGGVKPNCGMFKDYWSNIYGEVATDYYWLAVMGNHDWGNADHHAICAWGAPDPYILPSTKIPYDGNQLNQDKHGCNPHNYLLPDYAYHYEIKALDFEIIFLEETATICPNDNGGQNYSDCGSSTIGCEYLGKMRDASENMLKERAQNSKKKNFIIAQHYPSNGERLLNEFKKYRNNSKDDIIWSIYGHKHEQECQGKDSNGVCNLILTGGAAMGGGNELQGFYVIGFDENNHMIQPYKFDNSEISCNVPCGTNISDELIVKTAFQDCCTGITEEKNCNVFDLTKC